MAFIAFVATLCTWLRLMFVNPSFLPILTKAQTQRWIKGRFKGNDTKHQVWNVSLSLLEKSWHGAPRTPIVSDLFDRSKQHCFLCRMQCPFFLNFTSEGAMSRSSGIVFVINSMMSPNIQPSLNQRSRHSWHPLSISTLANDYGIKMTTMII